MNRTARGLALCGCLLLAASAQARIRTGLDVLEATRFEALKGKKVGLITNRTGVDADGRANVDVMRRAGIDVRVIFSPEHGFSGLAEAGKTIADARYPGTSIPIYSLYGATKRPTDAMLSGLDALVFDIQDVGTRFYTYITTMGYALEEAARHDIEFIVLDRPNPLGGLIVEGEALDESIRHFTAYYSVPTRHGLTVGELARWHNDHARLNAKLTVVRMQGWRRAMWWGETGLKFIPPSPNIRTPRAMLFYAGLGAFESTNVSVGRGTGAAFEIFGAPWLDSAEAAKRLNALNLPGVRFTPETFTPGSDVHHDQLCRGVRVVNTNRDAARPVDVFVHAACLLRDLHPADFQPRWDEMPYVVGSRDFQTLFSSGAPAEKILERIHASAEKFLEDRKPFLLYE